MNRNFIEISHIVCGENEISKKSEQKLNPWLKKSECLLNFLLKLNYHKTPVKIDSYDDSDGYFYIFVSEKYIAAPRSIHVCNDLMQNGHYLDATILLRSLFDNFVLCRYLYNYKNYTRNYLHGEKVKIGKKNTHIGQKIIYEKFSPGFYSKYYGDWLSAVAHGKYKAHNYTVDRADPDNPRTIVIPEFNLDHASIIIKSLIPIFFGYLSWFNVFFEESERDLPADIEEERICLINWLQDQHKKNLESHPKSQDWYKAINKLIGISEE